MSTNLNQLVQHALSAPVSDFVAEKIEVSSADATDAIERCKDVVLGGLINLASHSEGELQLQRLIADHQDELSNVFDGDLHLETRMENIRSLTELGNSILTCLFGENRYSLIAMIAPGLQLDLGKTEWLMNFVSPVVVEATRQRLELGSSDPADFRQIVLEESGNLNLEPPYLSRIADFQAFASPNEYPTGPELDPETEKLVKHIEHVSEEGLQLFKLLVPMVLVACLGFLIFSLVNRGNPTFQAQRVLDNHFSTVMNSVKKIEDDESTKLAVEKVTAATAAVDELNLEELPLISRKDLSPTIKTFIEEFDSAVDEAFAIPGAKAQLEPAANGLLERLNQFLFTLDKKKADT